MRPGTTAALARAPVAEDVGEADPAGDAAAFERVAAWAIRRFTPLVAVDPPDGLWLDITGASHLHGGEAALLGKLVARLAASGLTARAAVGPTPGCAHAVARFGAERITCVGDHTAGIEDRTARGDRAALGDCIAGSGANSIAGWDGGRITGVENSIAGSGGNRMTDFGGRIARGGDHTARGDERIACADRDRIARSDRDHLASGGNSIACSGGGHTAGVGDCIVAFGASNVVGFGANGGADFDRNNIAGSGGDGIACIVDAAAALDPLPVAALRLDEAALETLRRLGLDRIAALRAVARGPLARRLGAGVVLRLDQALGAVAEPVAWAAPPVRFDAACRLLEPIVTADAVRHVVDRLCAELCAAAAAAGVGFRVADLRFDRVDGDVVAVRAGTSRPTRDAAHLAKLFAARIETIDPGFGLESATLTAVLTEPLLPEQLGDEAQAADLTGLVDRLASRLGRRRVYRTTARDSDLPERSVRRIAAVAGSPVDGAGRHAARRPHAPAGWAGYARPVRLFDPPEYVVATAALPDHPPVRFRWRGVWHRVAAADGPERVFGEWWLTDAELSSVRDYFAVEDDAGARFWLFRAGDGIDPATGSMDWYLQGLW